MDSNKSPLARVMARNRLQQKHVAEALPVSRFTVWQWVHERAVPTGTNLSRLLDFLRQFEPTLQAGDLLSAAGEASPAADPTPVAEKA